MRAEPIQVEPNVDAYGARTRYETLADILEVAALGGGGSPTRAELADYVRDRNWLRKEYDLFSIAVDPEEDSSEPAGSLGEETDSAHGIAEGVFEVLRDRIRHYSDRYPFELERSRLVERDSREAAHDRYLAFLAASFLHGHGIETDGSPPSKRVESMVVASLEAGGLLAAGLGTGNRGTDSFEQALAAVAAKLRLKAHAGQVILSKKVQDAGIDVVGRLDFGDDGFGKWIVIGQVTVGAGETWSKKAQEPSRSRWMRLLGLSTWPMRFLAVPHEIPEAYRLDICTQTDHSVFLLDRRRLVFPERQLLVEEEHLIGDLRRIQLEGFS